MIRQMPQGWAAFSERGRRVSRFYQTREGAESRLAELDVLAQRRRAQSLIRGRSRPGRRSVWGVQSQARMRARLERHMGHDADSVCVCDTGDRNDPTGTGKIRRAFTAEVDRRFSRFLALLRVAIVEKDVLGLSSDLVRGADSLAVADDVPELEAGAFRFTRSASKAPLFMAWLRTAADELLLGIETGVAVESVGNRAWTSTYIRRGYEKGVGDAAGRVRDAGGRVSRGWVAGAFDRPIHADRVGLIYTRVFTELDGITKKMDQQLSEVLAGGVAEGIGPQEMARRLADRVEKVGRTRARVLARTEIIATHAEATLNSYREAAIEGVAVESEFSTSRDDAVCPECEALESEVFSLEAAAGIIPVHPNCRCAWIPVVGDPEEIDLG